MPVVLVGKTSERTCERKCMHKWFAGLGSDCSVLLLKAKSCVNSRQRKLAGGGAELEQMCVISSPGRQKVSPGQPGTGGDGGGAGEERGVKWSGEEGKSSEFRTDVRKCFFLQKLLSMWNGSWQYCWCSDAGPTPGAVKCGGGKKEQRVNKGWVSVP